MKTPFRLQASEYDCVPTTALNALSYLYERNEIPPLAIQRIFMYCLDSVSSRQNLGHGTTSYAVQLFGNWLNEFRKNKFQTNATYITGSDVNLSQNNKIARTLNSGGAALIRIKTSGKSWHYILGLTLDESWLYAFDPHPGRNSKNSYDKYEFIKPKTGQSPNLRIRRDWIGIKSSKSPYRFGNESDREALLLERATT